MITEILITITIASIALFALNTLMVVSLDFVVQTLHTTQATILAQEGIEAVRILRNASWSNNIATLSPGATYYPSFSGATWTLQASSPGLINNIFTRSLIAENVLRDLNNDIAASGTPDPNTKKISLTMTWQEHGQAKTIVVMTYITNILGN